MFNRNNGSNENNRLQNQFTAYLKKAVHFRRIRYLADRSRVARNEQSLTDSEFALPDKIDIIQEIADYEAMQQAMKSIKEKDGSDKSLRHRGILWLGTSRYYPCRPLSRYRRGQIPICC